MNKESSKVLERLPVFSEDGDGSSWKNLSVLGLVKNPLTLSRNDLAELPVQTITDDFECEEGWSVPQQVWTGVPVSAILDSAGPLPNANYASFSSGDFTVSLTLDEIGQTGALLATQLNGQSLPSEHGGPCRLVAPTKQCYFSVKWVDRIELTAIEPANTGMQIAKSRIRQM